MAIEQPSSLVGKTFGGYRLVELVDSAAHSAVYAAEQTSSSEKVTLRLFGVDLSRDKSLAARLVADLQKASAVQHPVLAPVRDIGTADWKGKKHLYIASERFEGETLKARLAQAPGQPLPLGTVLTIASEVGAALQAVHRAGGTHRHLEPGSILLVKGKGGADAASSDEKVYLYDLGAALVPTNDSGQGKGAKGGKVQDDIRSLAHLVQEMLGGAAATPVAGSQAVLPVRFKNRQVPARLDAVLRAALGDTLGTDKSSRFESVASLVAALHGTPESQPSFGSWSEDGRTLPRPRASTSGSLMWAALLAVLVGAVVGYWLYSQEPAAPVPVPPPGPVPPAVTAPAVTPPPAPPSAPTVKADAGTDAGARSGRPGAWPVRKGTIPPLRDADPAPPTPPATPTAAGAGPGSAPPAVRVPAAAPAGGAGVGAPSAPAAPGPTPAAKTPAPPQGSGAAAPGPSGQKEVK